MVHLQENLTHKFVKRGSWLYLFAFLTGPLGYAIKIMISHDLSVSQVGVLYGVLSFIMLVSSVNDLGMVESLNHFVPKFISQGKNEKVKSFFIYAGSCMFLTSLVCAATLWFGANWLGDVYFGDMETVVILQYFCAFLILSNIQHFLSTIFLIYQDTKYSKGLDALRLFVSLGFGYQIYATGQGSLENYAGIWNYGVIATSVFGICLAWKRHLGKLFRETEFSFSKSDVKELFQYSIWALLASNITLLLSQLDVQMLLVMRGTTEVGIYSNYLSLIGIPFILLTPIIGMIFPVVSAYYGANRMQEITTIASTFARVFSILGLLTISVTVLYAEGSGVFFFGDKFRESGYILLYSIGFIIFNFLLQINFNLLAAVGKVKARLRITSMGLVVNLLLNLVLIHFFGAEGSAFAVGASWVFLWYLSYRETREYHDPFSWKTFFKNLAFCTILTIVLWQWMPREIAEIGKFGYFASLIVSAFLFTIGFFIMNRVEILNAYRTLKKTKP